MRREQGVSDTRGVSDVVGVAILISLSIVGSLAIVAIGGVALNAITDQAQQDLADDSLRNVDARLSALAESPVDSTAEFTFPEGAGERLEANASAGDVTISATAVNDSRFRNETVEYHETGSYDCTVSQQMGTIVHEKDNGNVVVYQGGGLWRQTPSGTQVESAPQLDYDGDATQFSFINLTSIDSISEGETLTAEKLAEESRTATANITSSLQDCWQLQGVSGTVPVNIDVTIESKYADGWARYARNGMTESPDAVTLDNARNEVTLQFGDVGNVSDVFDTTFGGNVIYTGLSQYARFQPNITATGPGFTVEDSTYQFGLFYQDEGRWVEYDEATDSWDYAKNYPGSVTESELPVSTSTTGGDTVYDVDSNELVCIAGGGSNLRGYISGGTAHCTENMTGLDSDAVLEGPDTATFAVSDLSATPTTLEEGETVDVEADIENTGEAEDTQYVALVAVNSNNTDDNEVVDYTQRTLSASDPPSSVSLSWNTSAGDRRYDGVAIATEDDVATGSLTIDENLTNPTQFAVSSVSASSSPVRVGETVSVSADVTNLNGTRESQYVWVTDVDGNLVNATQVTVDPSSTKRVTLNYTQGSPSGATPTTGDVTVSTDYDDDSDSLTVDSGPSSSGVQYIGPAGDTTAESYVIESGYSGQGGNDTAGMSGILQDTGSISNGYVIDQRDDPEYDVYVGDTDLNTWQEVVQGTDRHRYVTGNDVSGVSDNEVYNAVAVESDALVCIVEEGASIDSDPSTSDCGAIYNTTGGFDYDSGNNTLDVDADEGNLSVLTTQVGERVDEREDVRRPLDVFFVIDESGSMGDYDYRETEYWYSESGTVTVPDDEVWVLSNDDLLIPGEEANRSDVDYAEQYTGDGGADPYGKRIRATRSFVGSLNDSVDQAGATQFDYTASRVIGLTDDFDQINGSLEIDPGGSTNIGGGMEDARSGLNDAADPDKQVMVVLTDGKHNYGTDPLTAAERAAEDNITVYTVGLGSGVNETRLQEIADETGGEYYFADDADALEEQFDKIAEDATNDALVQRSRTEVTAVDEGSTVTEVQLSGDSNLNDPTQFNTSSSDSIEEQIASGLENASLSFEVTVYGCDNYTAVDGVTSTVNGTTYTHATCSAYNTTDTTTIDNDDATEHVIITANNSNSLSDVSSGGDWQPDPASVSPVNESDLSDGEAIIGLEVTHENQTGYVLLSVEVPTNETVRDTVTNPGGTDDTANFQIRTVTDDGPVTEGEDVTVDVTVENTNDVTGTQSIALVDENGNVVDSLPTTLAPGDVPTISLAWNSTGAAAGNTTLTVRTRDDTNDTTVNVNGERANYTISSFDVGPTDVTAGQTISAEADIENEGNESAQRVVVLQIPDGNGNWSVVDARSLDLAPGDSPVSVNMTWETGPGDAGTARLRLSTYDNAAIENGLSVSTDSADSNIGSNIGDGSSDPISIDISQIKIE